MLHLVFERATILKISFSFVLLFFTAMSFAADRFDPKDYQAEASFKLVVDKAKYLKPGTSKVSAQSAFVSLVHGLMPGNSDGLEVMFFSKPITEADLPDIINNEAKGLRKSSHAALVLFLDKESKVWQVNLSYVVPGTTVARTVAAARSADPMQSGMLSPW